MTCEERYVCSDCGEVFTKMVAYLTHQGREKHGSFMQQERDKKARKRLEAIDTHSALID